MAAVAHPANQADPATQVDSVLQAQVNLVLAGGEQEIEEAVADKGYHKAETLAECEEWNTRTYIPEPKRKKYNWGDKPQAWRRRRTGVGPVGHVVSGCRRSAVSWWSGASLTRARRAAGGGHGCEG